MERIQDTRNSGLTGGGLRTWGMLFAAIGIVGRGLLQNRMLGLGFVTTEQLLEKMMASDAAMLYATLSLVFQAVETCAVPIFAFLLAEGVEHTADLGRYLLRVLGAAVLSEIPYNLAISGQILDLGTRNPMFGLVFGLAAVYFFKRYSEKRAAHLLIRILVTVAAMLWCVMLSVDYGGGLVMLTVVLWSLRKKPLYRNMAGAAVAMLCAVSSMAYLASPMAFLVIHFYNGEPGEASRAKRYLAYPALLLVLGLAGVYLV